MKRWGMPLLVLAGCLLAACSHAGASTNAAPEPIPWPESEMESPSQQAAGESPPFVVDDPGVFEPYEEPERRDEDFIVFHIRDRDGNPLPYVGGGLEMTIGDGASGAVAYSGLGAKHPKEPIFMGTTIKVPEENSYSDADGNLYLWVNPETAHRDSFLGAQCKLNLYAYYDDSLSQAMNITIPEFAPATLDITWNQETPPSQRAPQTTGVRFVIVGVDGQPMPGILLHGTNYPEEHEGFVPAIAGPYIGPTEEEGVIRWDGDFEPGTYEIGFSDVNAEDSYLPYTLHHPGGPELLEIAIEWEF